MLNGYIVTYVSPLGLCYLIQTIQTDRECVGTDDTVATITEDADGKSAIEMTDWVYSK